jgi:hypothetical protein
VIRRRIFAVLFAALSAFGPPALADDDVGMAQQFFRAARAAYGRSDFRAAAIAFEEAFRRAPRAGSIYNAAVAWEEAKEPERAADDYAACEARDDLAPEQRADAQQRLLVIERSLGRVDITGPADATAALAHATRVPLPAHVHVRPGTYEVHVTFGDGRTALQTASVAVGQTVALDIPPPPPLPPSRDKAATRPEALPAPPPPAPVPVPSHASAARVFGWIGIGASVASAGAAVFFGVATLDAHTEFDDSGQIDRAAHDRGVTFRTLTNVAWATAGVLGAGGLTLLIVLPARSRPTTTLAITGRGLAWGAAF